MSSEVQEIKWGPIGHEVFQRTYSRTKADGTKESWPETVERVIEGNIGFVPRKFTDNQEKESLRKMMTDFRLIPAGRHLWVTGIKGSQFVQNCWSSPFPPNLPFSRHFTLLFDLSMQGGGVGSNYSNRYIEHYGAVNNKVNVHFVCQETHNDHEALKPYLSEEYSPLWDGCHTVMDSREGWTNTLRTVLDSYNIGVKSGNPDNVVIVVDVSQVRPKDALIKGFGGVASGPLPLMDMLKSVTERLNLVNGNGIKSLDCMEIDHAIAECVISGNVRRSSRMSFKSWEDPDIFEFITCKLPITDKDGTTLSQPHWSTNISVEIDDNYLRAIRRKNPHALKVAKMICEGMLKNSEPGIFNRTLASVGEPAPVYVSNPCGEIAFPEWENDDPTSLNYMDTVESCNLCQVNLAQFFTPRGKFMLDSAIEAFRMAARFLIRATFCDVPDEMALEILRTNRRIGVGFTGYHAWVAKQGVRYSESHHDPKIRKHLRKFKEAVIDEARKYASQLRIPCPIKHTAIAPCGTISKLPGTTEGSNAFYAKYFQRIVRFQTNDPQLEELSAKGYKTEPDFYSKNTTCVYFTCKDPLVEDLELLGMDPEEVLEDAFEVSVSDYLAVQAMIQEEYADNAVSYTVNLPIEHGHTPETLGITLINHLPRLKGVTLMVDDSYTQAPLTRITKETYETAQVREVKDFVRECKNGACPVR